MAFHSIWLGWMLLVMILQAASVAHSFVIRRSGIVDTIFLGAVQRHATSNTGECHFQQVQHIESHADWMELLWQDDDVDDDDDEEEDGSDTPKQHPKRITAVSFHASWCRYCLKFQRKWNHQMVRSPLFQTNPSRLLQFASVEYGANRKLCQSLHIQQLPTVQFYYGEDLLTSFPCPPKQFQQLPRTLVTYLEMSHEQLEQVTQAYQDQAQAARSSSSNDTQKSTLPVEITEDGTELTAALQEEPELFSRKRDRLRKKLPRS